MNINTVYKFIQFIAAKNQSGYISPDLFNSFFAKAEISHFNDLYGRFQELRSGSSLPKSGYGQSQIIDESLAVFINPMIRVHIDSEGASSDFPANIYHIDSVFADFESSLVEVRRVKPDHLANELQSRIAPPTLKYPIYLEYDKFLAVYPPAIGSVILTYLRKPNSAVWAYTTTGAGNSQRPIYDPIRSQDSEFDDTQMGDVISKFLEYVGISMSSQELEQFGMRKDRSGD